MAFIWICLLVGCDLALFSNTIPLIMYSGFSFVKNKLLIDIANLSLVTSVTKHLGPPVVCFPPTWHLVAELWGLLTLWMLETLDILVFLWCCLWQRLSTCPKPELRYCKAEQSMAVCPSQELNRKLCFLKFWVVEAWTLTSVVMTSGLGVTPVAIQLSLVYSVLCAT